MQETRFFCDRCGKRYFRTSGRYLKLLNSLDNPYDLCPECFESLQKWFNREPESEREGERTETIKFQTSKGIVTGYLDPQKQIVYFNGLTMEFIRKVLKWEEVKDERETESKEAEERT